MSAPPGAAAAAPDPAPKSAATDKAVTSSFEDTDAHASAFEALEKEFQEVIKTLVDDESLKKFRVEYEKLHTTLKRSHENERKLIHKCKELSAELSANAAKMNTALRLSLQDQQTISMLRKEIDNAWKLVSAAQEKDSKQREQIQKLKAEIQNLARLVDQGMTLSVGHETAVNEKLREIEDLKKEREMTALTVDNHKREMDRLQERVKHLEETRHLLEKEITTLKTKNAAQLEQLQSQKRLYENLSHEIKNVGTASDMRKQELERKDAELATLKKLHEELDGKNRELESYVSVLTSELESFRERQAEMSKELDDLRRKESDLVASKAASDAEVSKQHAEVKAKVQELAVMHKARLRVERERDQALAAKNDAERQKNWLKEELKALSKSFDGLRRDGETDEKMIKKQQEEIKKLKLALLAATEKNSMHSKLVDEHEGLKKRLEEDIVAHKGEEQELRKRNYHLEKQKEKVALDGANTKAKLQETLETLKLKEMEIEELKKQVNEERTKLKAQQNMYEAVRSDRNLFSKLQVQSEDEIAELNRKFKIMNHQIEQLKEEMQRKDNALIDEQFAFKKLQEENKLFHRKLTKSKEVLTEAAKVLAAQDAEIKNLRRTIQEAEAAQAQQRGIYEDVVQERDILGTQLIRRNDELALLYEKIRIQQSILNKGEVQYRERVEELRTMRTRLQDAKRQLQIRAHEVSNIDALKNELYHLQRELLQERTKVKALSEELENPMNVHRWRKLEGSDPKRFELLQKIQTLQKRLISKTEACVEKDLLLQEKEKLYQDLKNLLARQPGPEVIEQVTSYQHNLKEKSRQLKAMAAEMNMLQARCNEYQFELERTNRDLQEMRRKFYDLKRKEQLAREHAKATVAAEAQQNDPRRLMSKTIA